MNAGESERDRQGQHQIEHRETREGISDGRTGGHGAAAVRPQRPEAVSDPARNRS